MGDEKKGLDGGLGVLFWGLTPNFNDFVFKMATYNSKMRTQINIEDQIEGN
jgi:hypothetical protein